MSRATPADLIGRKTALPGHRSLLSDLQGMAQLTKNPGCYLMALVGLTLSFSMAGSSANVAQGSSAYIGEVRSLDTNDLGVLNPAGLAYSPDANTVLAFELRSTTQANIITMTPSEDMVGSVRVHVPMMDPINIASGGQGNRLVLFESVSDKLIEIKAEPAGYLDPSSEAISRYQLRPLGLQDPRSMATDVANGYPGMGRCVLGLTASDEATITKNTESSTTIRVPQDQLTIQEAINAAQDGDLVLVSPDTYTEQLTLSGKTITLASQFHTTGDPSFIEQTIIDGGGQNVITVSSSVGPDTSIIGFTIRNGSDGIKAYAKLHILNNRFTGHSDAIDYEAGGGICRNNVFEDNSDDAIDLDGATEGIIEDNTIRNSRDDGIEIRLHEYSGPTLNIIIRGNIIIGNGEDGIQLIDYSDVSDRVFLIERNLIEDSAMVGLGLMDGGDTMEDFRAASVPERIHVFSNTFADNPYHVTGGDNLIALNNLFVNSTSIALKEVDGESIAAYNLFWNNGTDNQGSNVDDGTTLYADPLLDSEYHLRQGSPAIDAGTAHFQWQGQTVLDLPSSAYYSTAPDLGMYEYSPNQPPNVEAGPDQTVILADGVVLDGTVSDDGSPDPPGVVTTTWSRVSGSGVVTFADAHAVDTTADFSAVGRYVLRLTADDGELTANDEVTLVVIQKLIHLPLVHRSFVRYFAPKS